jgi:hypothetical protein
MTLRLEKSRTEGKNYHAPTGILTGPLDDSKRRLIHPAVVLMKLESKLELTLGIV